MKYRILVKAGSLREEVVRVSEDELVVYTHAWAHENAANRKVIEILAEYFGVAKGRARILKGEKSRMKIVEVWQARIGFVNSTKKLLREIKKFGKCTGGYCVKSKIRKCINCIYCDIKMFWLFFEFF